MQSPSIRFLAPVALALGAAGCGRHASAPPRGLLHLDPRLADGRSSAEQLAAVRHAVASWKPESGGSLAFAKRSGDELAGSGGRGFAPNSGAIAFEAPFGQPAARANALTLALKAAHPGRAVLRWRRARAESGAAGATSAVQDSPWPDGLSQEIAYGGSPELQLLTFSLGLHSGWSGTIEALRLEPDSTRAQPLELVAVELLQQGYVQGASPLDEQLAPRSAGDGGLVSLDGSAVRAWPAAFDQPLVCSAALPTGAKLCLDTGLMPALRGLVERVDLAVELRAAGGPWSKIATRALRPKERPGETLWRPWAIDLSAWGGSAVELRLSAHAASAESSLPADSAAVLWGAPVITSAAEPQERLPNIVLVTLDTTRAASCSFFGDGRTPYLDELARNGIACTQAFATANSTQPSHASILTGMQLQDHGVVNNFCVLAPENRTLPEALRERGYFTAAAVSQQYLGPNAGFGQGFDWFLEAAPEAPFDGAVTVRGARHFVDIWREQGDRPFFLWLHLFDPHTPYGPPQDYLDGYAQRYSDAPPASQEPADLPELDVLPAEMKFLEGVRSAALPRYLYRAEVAYADSLVENFAAHLAERGWLGTTAFAVTADHGESLGEHGSWFNHNGLFDEVVHVPLILTLPGGPAGVRIDSPVSTVDLAPSLLNLLSLPSGGLRGFDLVQMAREGADPARRVWFEGTLSEQVGCVDGAHHFIATLGERVRFGLGVARDAQGRRVAHEQPIPGGTRQLFDRAADPALLRDLSGSAPELLKSYEAELERFRASARPVRRIGRALTEADQEQLEKLGYTSR